MKRAESLSLQTIIIAAIVLVVFIVVILIFTKGIPKNLPKFNDCDPTACVPTSDKCGSGTVAIYGLGCDQIKDATGKVPNPPPKPYCCKKNDN
jgi:hypothetical protein